jgi:hypothetical protein
MFASVTQLTKAISNLLILAVLTLVSLCPSLPYIIRKSMQDFTILLSFGTIGKSDFAQTLAEY